MRVVKITNTRKSVQDRLNEALQSKKSEYIIGDKVIPQNRPKRTVYGKPPHVPVKGSATKIIESPPYVSEPTTRPQFHDVPEWFQSHGPVDISIIVPLYKSHVVIREQIQSWDLSDDGLTKEIIYVDDGCPFESYKSVMSAWEIRKQELRRPIGKVILNSHNRGYASSCNEGAAHASGKYLIFLNADCTVTPNWIRPLFDLLEQNPNIGMAGNLQFKKNGNIDSAGSQWSWKSRTFEHIGRNIHNGKPLHAPYTSHGIPSDLTKVGPREMVTGCCFIIPQKIFATIGGFDPSFRIGYWEDSDLNMKVQELGYKVYFQPNSIIYHKVGHSQAGGHPYMSSNKDLFQHRWVNSGRFEEYITTPRPGGKLTKSIKDSVKGDVIGCVIVCNEEEFLEASVDSVAPLVDRWYIVVGGNEYAYKAGMCDEKGFPKDNTLDIAKKLVGKYGGQVIEPPGRLWQDKVEMRNAYADKLHVGEWMFMLDGDEVYNSNQLWRCTELMQQYEVIIMNFHLLWNTVNTVGTGVWDNYPQERIVKWQPTYKYRGKNHLKVSTQNNSLACDLRPCYKQKERFFYHYSWIRPIEKIRQKVDYYKYQAGKETRNYVDEVFLKWRTDPESVRGRTHPLGGGDWSAFKGIHPPQVQKLIDEGKLNF